MKGRLKAGNSLTKILAVLVLAGSLVGCNIQTYDDAVASIQGGGTTPPPEPPPTPPPPGASFGPNFSEIQSGLFTPTCATSNCHSGGNPPAGLNLEAGSSYANTAFGSLNAPAITPALEVTAGAAIDLTSDEVMWVQEFVSGETPDGTPFTVAWPSNGAAAVT